MKKLLGFVLLFSVLSIGFVAHAQTTTTTTATAPDTTQAQKDEALVKAIVDRFQDKSSVGDFKGNMMWNDRSVKTTGGSLGTLWTIGWLFSIGYLGLTFWKGVLALIIWPYYLGKKFKKQDVVQ